MRLPERSRHLMIRFSSFFTQGGRVRLDMVGADGSIPHLAPPIIPLRFGGRCSSLLHLGNWDGPHNAAMAVCWARRPKLGAEASVGLFAGDEHPPDNLPSESTMGLSRRFQNVIMENRFETAPNEHCKVDCFSLADRTVLWADHLGRTFLLDAETRQINIVPKLHKPKRMPFSLFVPDADADSDYYQDRFGSSLFVMERIPKPEGNDCSSNSKWSEQFEAFIYRMPTMAICFKSWQCQLIPPPPYVRHLKYRHDYRCPEITVYGWISVGGESRICISVEDVGTYCMDAARHKWSKAGKWILPFHGRVEYVPELKLWFGFNKARHLAAADISAMDSQPRLVGSWKELCLPEEWKECKDPQLVNLGCGRFCILRFFHTSRAHNGEPGSDVDQDVAVFTGVEVVPCVQDANGGSGKVGLQMIPHKSLCHMSNDISINAAF